MPDNLHRKIKEGEEVSHSNKAGNIATFFIDPVPKPRMTRSDKWKKRPVVVHYFAYCDLLRLLANKSSFEVPAGNFHITFYISMPKSWSKKKMIEMDGKPHQQKPDKDNLEKAFLDALCGDDSYVWDARITKRWAKSGRIEVKKIAD